MHKDLLPRKERQNTKPRPRLETSSPPLGNPLPDQVTDASHKNYRDAGRLARRNSVSRPAGLALHLFLRHWQYCKTSMRPNGKVDVLDVHTTRDRRVLVVTVECQALAGSPIHDHRNAPYHILQTSVKLETGGSRIIRSDREKCV